MIQLQKKILSKEVPCLKVSFLFMPIRKKSSKFQNTTAFLLVNNHILISFIRAENDKRKLAFKHATFLFFTISKQKMNFIGVPNNDTSTLSLDHLNLFL